MAAKKGVTPAHVKSKAFSHPRIDHPVIQILSRVEDPRKPSLFFRHPLTSVLFMALVTTICGAKDWPQIVVMSQGMEKWLENYVDMSRGVPCERTFKNIFNSIKPEAMEKALQELATILRQKILGEVVSFDGQTEKGTADKNTDHSGIHLLHAWSSDNDICLAQLKVDDKSNEITAMPKLMDMLDLKGTVVTADALNTQKTIAAKAIEGEADYFLPVKGNQGTLLQEMTSAFEQFDVEATQAKKHWERAVSKAEENRDKPELKKLLDEGPRSCGASVWQSVEKGHGRIETRTCTTLWAKDLPSREAWEELKTIVRMCRERKVGESVHKETIYYITSLTSDSELAADIARRHWGIENGLHWRLDVIFRQDKSRYRDRVGARNLAAIRKMALNALLKETTMKRGVATKQCAAAINPEYREKVLKNLF